MKRISWWKTHTVPFHRDSRCKHNALLCTFDGLALGQDGDCSLCHLLLVHNRWDLWAPAVRTHPDEMTRLVGLFSCVKEPPAMVKKTDVAANKVNVRTSFDFVQQFIKELDWNSCAPSCFCVVFKGALYSQALPDIVLVGEKYDYPCVWVFSKSPDDLVKLLLPGLAGNLDRLWDTQASWKYTSS